MKKSIAVILVIMMLALVPVNAFAAEENNAAVSTITYRLTDEMYAAGVRFYSTDAQEKTATIDTGEPFNVTGFVALKYKNNKLNGVNWKNLTEVQGYKLKDNVRTDITLKENQAVSTLDQTNTDKSLIYDINFAPGTNLTLEASAGVIFDDNDKVSVKAVIPKRMSVRLQDGTILKNGDSFTMPEGGTVKFQMCTNNWGTDTYTDDGQGIAGTKVYSFTHVKGKNNTLRVDTNTYFMAYRFHFEKGDYNKQTGINKVLPTPLESLSVNLPLGSVVTVGAFKNISTEITKADVFIETAADKTLSYTDYTWSY